MCLRFFIELNVIMSKKNNKNFNLFKILHDKNDVISIVAYYKKLFAKKSYYYEKKLLKIIIYSI